MERAPFNVGEVNRRLPLDILQTASRKVFGRDGIPNEERKSATVDAVVDIIGYLITWKKMVFWRSRSSNGAVRQRRGVQQHRALGAIRWQVIRRCLLLLCALTSCAPANRDAWKTTLSLRSKGLCWWRDARWEDRGPLLVRGTGQPFARARAQWSGQLWRGSSISAVLRRAGPVVLLQGQWAGPGLTLDAEVDVSLNSVFRAYEPVRVGPAGLLLKGGHVRVADADLGRRLCRRVSHWPRDRGG